jgi:hypothetical protein
MPQSVSQDTVEGYFWPRNGLPDQSGFARRRTKTSVAQCLGVGVSLLVLLSSLNQCGGTVPASEELAGPQRAAGDLDGQLLRGIGGSPAKASESPASAAQRRRPSKKDGDPQVKPVDPFAHGEDVQAGPSQAVFQSIERRMGEVQQRLRELDTSGATQQLQQRIVADLDAVIQQMQQQLADQSSGEQQITPTGQQGQPSDDDGGQTGDRSTTGTPDQTPDEEGRVTETDAMRQALDRFWGNLPERVRRQVQNMSNVEFLPEYQQLIEDYYRRLAEERQR